MRLQNITVLTIAITCILSSGCDSGSSRKRTTPSATTKKIFITQGSYDGNLVAAATTAGGTVSTGIQAADYLCTTDSNKPATGTYKALIVDHTDNQRIACTTPQCSGGASEHVNWVLAANTTYYRADGTTVIGTTTANGIFDFTTDLQNSMGTTTTTVWTGLTNSWSTRNYDCGGWDASEVEGDAGGTDSLSTGSIGHTWYFCNMDTANLICVEQ